MPNDLTDDEKRAIIISTFFHSIMIYPLDDPRSYIGLCYDLSKLIDDRLKKMIALREAYGDFINDCKKSPTKKEMLSVEQQLQDIIDATNRKENEDNWER